MQGGIGGDRGLAHWAGMVSNSSLSQPILCFLILVEPLAGIKGIIQRERDLCRESLAVTPSYWFRREVARSTAVREGDLRLVQNWPRPRVSMLDIENRCEGQASLHRNPYGDTDDKSPTHNISMILLGYAS
jgi:hypothetical protein